MRPNTTIRHPLLILLAVALVSVLFVVSCGGGATATAVPGSGAAAAELTAAEAAADAARLAEIADIGSAAEAVAAAAAAAAAVEGGPKYGGSLKFVMAPNWITLDPPFQLGDPDLAITQATYDNLLMIQPDLTIKPELAVSWEPNEDFSSYTFKLRKGVKFHHGKDFKAEDVVFTVERMLDPVLDSPIRPTFEVIEEMVVLDDYTIRFDLDAPNAFFPTYFSVFPSANPPRRRGCRPAGPGRVRDRALHPCGEPAGRTRHHGAEPRLLGGG